MSSLMRSLTENLTIGAPEQRVWTNEEFMALGRDGDRYDLVAGELINRGNSSAKHGYMAIILSSALFAVVMAQKLEVILDFSTAFKLKNGNKRSPVVSFFAREGLQELEDLPMDFLEGAPDLALAILSPNNTFAEIDSQLIEDFENGSCLVWVINPSQYYVLIYRWVQEPDRLLKSADSLEGKEVISGFWLPVAELFPKLSF